MQRGQRPPREVPTRYSVVGGQVVDLLLGVGQEAGPEQRLLAHEHRRDDRLEAVAAELLQRPAHERELEQDEVAAQVGEARPRQARRRAPCRSGRRPARGGPWRPRPTRARRARRRRRPRRRRSGRAGSGASASAPCSSASTALELGVERPSRARDLLHARRSPPRRRRPRAWPRRSRPPAVVLLGAQPLDLRDQLAPAARRARAPRRSARRILAAARQRGTDRVGVRRGP